MDLKTLEKNFHVLAEAPGGVQRLRELVVQLAIQGKLTVRVEQDGAARELLEAISREKQQLAKAGRLRKLPGSSPVQKDEMAFVLPASWAWVRAQDVFLVITDGDHQAPPKTDAGIPFLVISNVRWNGVDFTDTRYVSEKYFNSLDSVRIPQRGDILYTVTGSYGIPVPVETDRRFCVQRHIAILKPSRHIDAGYLSTVLGSRHVYDQATECATGTAQKTVPLTGLRRITLPLPPLPEQKRIVAKVNELMARCDELEAKQQQAHQTRISLNNASLDRLLNASDAREFATHWQRICDHFDLLYNHPANVTALRQSILELAVMGKLVRQRDEGEAVERLIAEIGEEKRHTKAAGRRNSSESEPLDETQPLFSIPSSWRWRKLDDVTINSDSGWSPKCETRPAEKNEWGVLKVSAVSWGQYRAQENKALPVGIEPREECAVRAGDFLMSRANTEALVGRSVVVKNTPPRLLLSDKHVRLRLSKHVASEFVNIVNNSNHARRYYAMKSSGTSSSMKNLTRGAILGLPIPLPPASEQLRIVTKVNELMALCDELGSMLQIASEAGGRLASSVCVSLAAS